MNTVKSLLIAALALVGLQASAQTMKFAHIETQKFMSELPEYIAATKTLQEEAKKLGGEAILCRTGASYTRAEINKQQIPFGGEFSGHFAFTDRYIGIDDGIYSGLRMLEILSNTNLDMRDKYFKNIYRDVAFVKYLSLFELSIFPKAFAIFFTCSIYILMLTQI